MSHFVFVYGSLKQGHWNNHILDGAKLIGPAVSSTDSYSMVDGAFPWVIPEGNSYIKGELYHVTDDKIMARLDRLEGHPDMFIRTPITINSEGTEVEAEIYFASKQSMRHLQRVGRMVNPNEHNQCEWGV